MHTVRVYFEHILYIDGRHKYERNSYTSDVHRGYHSSEQWVASISMFYYSVCVCLSAIISSELHVRASPIFVSVTYGRGSIHLWRRNYTLCISGFIDDVIFVIRRRRQA